MIKEELIRKIKALPKHRFLTDKKEFIKSDVISRKQVIELILLGDSKETIKCLWCGKNSLAYKSRRAKFCCKECSEKYKIREEYNNKLNK